MADEKKPVESVKITVTSAENRDTVLKIKIRFGNKRHRVNNLVNISLNTLCPVCCYWRHIIIHCPNIDR